MKTENLKVWTTDLRTTDANQTQGKLAIALDDSGTDAEYCCLGRGCVAMGLEGRLVSGSRTLQFNGADDLPPVEFLVWLGLYETVPEALAALTPMGIRTEFEVIIDWTDNTGQVIEFWDESDPFEHGASSLNDDLHLTFDQIADVLDWFGIQR